MSEVQAPIIKDATGQSMLTQLTAMVTKLQGIIDGLTPVASQIGVTTTGMHIVTENDVQGAISELDGAVDEVSSNLANLIIPFSTTLSNISADGSGNQEVSIDVPNGYTMQAIVVNQPSLLNRFIVWGGSVNNSTNKIYVMYINLRTSTVSTANIAGVVLCTKN